MTCFARISAETSVDDYIDFNRETVTSEPSIDPLDVDWRQTCREKSINEVIQDVTCVEVDTVQNDSSSGEDEDIATNIVTSSEALQCLDGVKRYAEVHGDVLLNNMLNELIGKMESIKLKNLKQCGIKQFFK